MADESSTPEQQGQQPQGETPEAVDHAAEVEKWKALSRKNEKAARDAQKELEQAQVTLKEREDATKSEHEKALDAARVEGRKAAQAEFDQERKGDRLRVAISKHARELADVDDVVLNVERGDLDGLFDKDGAVDDKALESTLGDLLERKPHLKAGPSGPPSGDADGGRGQGGSSLSPEAQHNNDLLRLAGLKRT